MEIKEVNPQVRKFVIELDEKELLGLKAGLTYGLEYFRDKTGKLTGANEWANLNITTIEALLKDLSEIK